MKYFISSIFVTRHIISMFHQQSPDSQSQPLSVYPRSYEELRIKNALPEYCSYIYPTQTLNQEFDIKSNQTFKANCGILNPMWPNHLDQMGRAQMPYPHMAYSQCSYSQFPNPANEHQYQMVRDNSTLLQHMKSMSRIDPLHVPNYQRLNMDDYNAMLASQCSKSEAMSQANNREKECVRCGMITGNAWQKDNNGHFLCLNCFRSNSYVNPALDMIPPFKRNQLTKNLARKQTAKRTGLQCSNCKSENTTLWRRNSDGQPVCNACGLYYRLHKTHRPPSMRKETLQTRKRKTKKKQSMCMKFMDSDYSIKSDLANSLDQQMMTSSLFPNVPPHISAHCLSAEKFDSSFRHHVFDVSQPQSNMRSSNLSDIGHPMPPLNNHHNEFEFIPGSC